MHAMNPIPNSQHQAQSAVQPVVLPAAPNVWTPAHHFHRIHDPAGFAWLNGLPVGKTEATVPMGRCFGMDVGYVALDLLFWFPNEMVLAIPFLEAVPPEYFLVCNEGGRRWWCFVVLRKGTQPTALVFDVEPSVLLIAGLGLRETNVDMQKNDVSRGRDFSYAPNSAVLCPMESAPIRYERLSPNTQEYFCLREVEAFDDLARTRGPAGVWALRNLPPDVVPLEISIGTPLLGLRMRVNEDEALMRCVNSLADGWHGRLAP
jgi:hypothetical protein